MKARALSASLLLGGLAHAQEPPPPPAAATQRGPAVEALRSTRAREPAPEPDAIKARIDGEYELRQSFLTALPLEPSAPDAPAHLDQTSRLFHWLRLRPLLLLGDHFEVRGEADVPRGMIYGSEPDAIPDSGTEFDRQQPLRVQARMLRFTARGPLGEVTVGHTTTELGMGLLDHTGDQPRFFGVPVRPATYERLALLSGEPDSQVRVGVSGELAFEQENLSLWDGDRLWRVALSARYAPTRRAQLDLLTRYESLGARGDRGGAQLFVFDLSGRVRAPLPGRAGELFAEYEAVYQVGDVAEPTALASGGEERVVAALAAAARLGVALERTAAFRRYAHLVVSFEWGMASGDPDPTDDELNRITLEPNHAPGLLLFGELLRFKTSRAQALLAREDARAGQARVFGLATRGGVAGATYLNPVLLVRPLPDLTLKVGGVVATSTTNVVDPSRLARTGERRNYDGGSPLARSLGSELDLGAELVVPLDPPMELRLSIEGGVAFPGSAFDDAEGNGLGTQAVTTAGLGLTF